MQPVGLSSVAGGLLPALIDGQIEGSRKEKAADPLLTVRSAISDYDLEKRSIESLAALGKKLPWLTVTDVKSVGAFNKPAEVLDRASVSQALIVKYDVDKQKEFRVGYSSKKNENYRGKIVSADGGDTPGDGYECVGVLLLAHTGTELAVGSPAPPIRPKAHSEQQHGDGRG